MQRPGCSLTVALRKRPPVWIPRMEEWITQPPPLTKSASAWRISPCPLVQALQSNANPKSSPSSSSEENGRESPPMTDTVSPTEYMKRSGISQGKVDRLVFGSAMGIFKTAKDADFSKAPHASVRVKDIFEAGLSIVDAYHLWPALRHKKWWLEHEFWLWIFARDYPQLCSVATACQYLYITWEDMFGGFFQFNADMAMHIMGAKGFTLTEWHALGFSFSEWCNIHPERPPHVAWVRWMRHTCCACDVMRMCVEPDEWSSFLGLTPSIARDVIRLFPTDLCQCGNAQKHHSTYLYEWMLVYPRSF